MTGATEQAGRALPPESPSPDLIAAYHRLYEIVWNETAVVEIDVAGHNGITYDDCAMIDAAAEVVEALLGSAAGLTTANSDSQSG